MARKIKPERQLAGFWIKYRPPMAALTRMAFEYLRDRLPGAKILVYDNYNALAIGFGPTEKSADALFSIVTYPKYLRLFFLQGAKLADPAGLLEGSAKKVRSLVIDSEQLLQNKQLDALIVRALGKHRATMADAKNGALIIKSISAKQRPRRAAPIDTRRRAARNTKG